MTHEQVLYWVQGFIAGKTDLNFADTNHVRHFLETHFSPNGGAKEETCIELKGQTFKAPLGIYETVLHVNGQTFYSKPWKAY